ncbi:hypothetical protein U14_00367 [Candidatus Moduliflexus flocculans]|uniref:Uncharacterized protein n=1 Tax=Candidatus Moduliflexus flocculans TaxID=1499966 RepID=A0A0S6VPU2_9BACT|nr:hypothetical protein U14_00367 [Candidatus Moduliflexus flocculans]
MEAHETDDINDRNIVISGLTLDATAFRILRQFGLKQASVFLLLKENILSLVVI